MTITSRFQRITPDGSTRLSAKTLLRSGSAIAVRVFEQPDSAGWPRVQRIAWHLDDEPAVLPVDVHRDRRLDVGLGGNQLDAGSPARAGNATASQAPWYGGPDGAAPSASRACTRARPRSRQSASAGILSPGFRDLGLEQQVSGCDRAKCLGTTDYADYADVSDASPEPVEGARRLRRSLIQADFAVLKRHLDSGIQGIPTCVSQRVKATDGCGAQGGPAANAAGSGGSAGRRRESHN